MTTELKQIIKKKYPEAKILKVGRWDWIFFPEKPEQEIREKMKEEQGRYNGKRQCWQFSNGFSVGHSNASTTFLLAHYGAEEIK